MNLEQKIEAILFYKNEPVEIKKLVTILGTNEGEVQMGLQNLKRSLQNRGISLILTNREACLATAPEMTDTLEQVARDEMSRDIGKAGLETLAIILYNGEEGVNRREIDYVRGVNSTFVLRNLLTRGLIERTLHTKDSRIFVYKPTISLFAHLGITNLAELSNLESFKKELSSFKNQEHAES